MRNNFEKRTIENDYNLDVKYPSNRIYTLIIISMVCFFIAYAIKDVNTIYSNISFLLLTFSGILNISIGLKRILFKEQVLINKESICYQISFLRIVLKRKRQFWKDIAYIEDIVPPVQKESQLSNGTEYWEMISMESIDKGRTFFRLLFPSDIRIDKSTIKLTDKEFKRITAKYLKLYDKERLKTLKEIKNVQFE